MNIASWQPTKLSSSPFYKERSKGLEQDYEERHVQLQDDHIQSAAGKEMQEGGIYPSSDEF